jgi:hypothetical protein
MVKRPGSARPFVPETRDLNKLANAAESCRGCDLYKRATQAVFGEGKRKARMVFVGEQPGDAEDRFPGAGDEDPRTAFARHGPGARCGARDHPPFRGSARGERKRVFQHARCRSEGGEIMPLLIAGRASLFLAENVRFLQCRRGA